MSKLDENGHEIPDPKKMAIPVRFQRVETLTDQMRRVIREEASRAAAMQGYETFDEADDFDVDDEYNPSSPHELTIDQELYGDEREPAGNDGSPQRETSNAGTGNSETGSGVEGGRQDNSVDATIPKPDKLSAG